MKKILFSILLVSFYSITFFNSQLTITQTQVKQVNKYLAQLKDKNVDINSAVNIKQYQAIQGKWLPSDIKSNKDLKSILQKLILNPNIKKQTKVFNYISRQLEYETQHADDPQYQLNSQRSLLNFQRAVKREISYIPALQIDPQIQQLLDSLKSTLDIALEAACQNKQIQFFDNTNKAIPIQIDQNDLFNIVKSIINDLNKIQPSQPNRNEFIKDAIYSNPNCDERIISFLRIIIDPSYKPPMSNADYCKQKIKLSSTTVVNNLPKPIQITQLSNGYWGNSFYLVGNESIPVGGNYVFKQTCDSCNDWSQGCCPNQLFWQTIDGSKKGNTNLGEPGCGNKTVTIKPDNTYSIQ